MLPDSHNPVPTFSLIHLLHTCAHFLARAACVTIATGLKADFSFSDFSGCKGRTLQAQLSLSGARQGAGGGGEGWSSPRLSVPVCPSVTFSRALGTSKPSISAERWHRLSLGQGRPLTRPSLRPYRQHGLLQHDTDADQTAGDGFPGRTPHF